MKITTQMVKELRDKTSAGMMDCKKALAESGGDFEKAITYLRQKSLATVSKKSQRATTEGIVTSYIHPGSKIGVMVELSSEITTRRRFFVPGRLYGSELLWWAAGLFNTRK